MALSSSIACNAPARWSCKYVVRPLLPSLLISAPSTERPLACSHVPRGGTSPFAVGAPSSSFLDLQVVSYRKNVRHALCLHFSDLLVHLFSHHALQSDVALTDNDVNRRDGA